MFIHVMDFSIKAFRTLVWDVESYTTEDVELLLEAMGYHLSQVAYMTSEDEFEDGGVVEVTDLMPNFRIDK